MQHLLVYAALRGLWQGKDARGGLRYICTLGLPGGLVNFVYPTSYLSRYSCISLAGFRTIFYHGAMVFTAVTMLLSGDHSFKGVTRFEQLLLSAVPALLAAVAANVANALIPGADYMFFKMDSFFFATVGRALRGDSARSSF